MVLPVCSSDERDTVGHPNRFCLMVKDYYAACKKRCAESDSDQNAVRDSILKTMIRLFVDARNVEFNRKVIQQVTQDNPRRLLGLDEAYALDLHNDLGEYTRLLGFARAGLLGFAKCKWYSPGLASNRTKIHKAIVAIINFMTEGLLEDELREYAIYTQRSIDYPCGGICNLHSAFLRILVDHRMVFFEFFNSTQFGSDLDGPTLIDYLTMTGKYNTAQLEDLTNSFVHCIQWFTERYSTYVNRAVRREEISSLVVHASN